MPRAGDAFLSHYDARDNFARARRVQPGQAITWENSEASSCRCCSPINSDVAYIVRCERAVSKQTRGRDVADVSNVSVVACRFWIRWVECVSCVKCCSCCDGVSSYVSSCDK